MNTEDKFYFGKHGQPERFAEIDVVNQLMQLAMKEGMADRMKPEIDRVLGSGSFDKLFKSYKSALISKRIMELKRQGKSTPEAFDLVLGAGAYKNMVGELYDALRAKAGAKHSRPGQPERFEKEYVLWGLPKGETDRLHEEVLSTKAKTPAQMDEIKRRAAKDGWHSFRVQILDLSKPYTRFSRPGQPERFEASSLNRGNFAEASSSPMLGKLLSEKQMPEGGWRAVETGGGALVISFEDGDVAGNFARRVAGSGYSATAPVQSIGRYWNVEVKNGKV